MKANTDSGFEKVKRCLILMHLYERALFQFQNWAYRTGKFSQELTGFLTDLVKSGKVSIQRDPAGIGDSDSGLFFPFHLEQYLHSKSSDPRLEIKRSEGLSREEFAKRLDFLRRVRNAVMHGRVPQEHISTIMGMLAEIFVTMAVWTSDIDSPPSFFRLFHLGEPDLEKLAAGKRLDSGRMALDYRRRTIQLVRTGSVRVRKGAAIGFTNTPLLAWVSQAPLPTSLSPGGEDEKSSALNVLREQFRRKAPKLRADELRVDPTELDARVVWSRFAPEYLRDDPFGIPLWRSIDQNREFFPAIFVCAAN